MGLNPPLHLLSNMLIKKTNSQGQKDFQRNGDNEDRSLIYRQWLRAVDCGYFLDVDLIKWKFNAGVPVPAAITDLTRTDREEVGAGYLEAIIDRIFNRDSQGKMLQTMAKLLKIPAYLVLFPKNMMWVWVLSFQNKKWKYFKIKDWMSFLRQL